MIPLIPTVGETVSSGYTYHQLVHWVLGRTTALTYSHSLRKTSVMFPSEKELLLFPGEISSLIFPNLKPLYLELRKKVLAADYLQVDETTLPVINHDRHKAAKEYIWIV